MKKDHEWKPDFCISQWLSVYAMWAYLQVIVIKPSGFSCMMTGMPAVQVISSQMENQTNKNQPKTNKQTTTPKTNSHKQNKTKQNKNPKKSQIYHLLYSSILPNTKAGVEIFKWTTASICLTDVHSNFNVKKRTVYPVLAVNSKKVS